MTRSSGEFEPEDGSLPNSNSQIDEIEVVEEQPVARTNFEGITLFQSIWHYPRGIYYIIGNEFCERFSFYGLKAVLALYLTDSLHYSDNTSTIIIHMFIFMAYFAALPGGYISDSFLGMFGP